MVVDCLTPVSVWRDLLKKYQIINMSIFIFIIVFNHVFQKNLQHQTNLQTFFIQILKFHYSDNYCLRFFKQ